MTSAINNLLEDLKIEDINIKDLYAILIDGKDILTVNEFKDKINNYINSISSNDENLRLRIIEKEEEYYNDSKKDF